MTVDEAACQALLRIITLKSARLAPVASRRYSQCWFEEETGR